MATGNMIATGEVDVAQIQTLLKQFGYYSGPVNGQYTFETVFAIDSYQKALGITPSSTHDDGRVGWGMWDSVTENATNYLVHYTSQGQNYWSGSFGRVTWDPSTSAPPPGASPNLPPDSGTELTPTIPITPTNPAPDDPDIDDAFAFVTKTLAEWGLTGLDEWTKDKLLRGWAVDRLLLELEETDQFKQRFPAMDARKQAGLPRISVGDYLDLERYYARTLTSAGLGSYFQDKNMITQLIINDVSAQEFEDRVLEGYRRVMTSAPEVREAFASYFGVDGDSALAAYYLDPDRLSDVLLQQTEQAAVGGSALRFGFSLGQTTALDLVQQGVNEQRANQGFATLQELEPVFSETLGETQDLTAMGEGLNAVFQTGMPGVRLIEGRVRSRKNMLSGQAGAAIDQGGILGFAGDS